MRSKGYDISASDDYERGHVLWHHAVDLIQGHHRALLDTRRFTTDEAILCAVAYCCEYPYRVPLTQLARNMREVLAALDCSEPARFSPAELLAEPHPNTAEGKKNPTWPVNQKLGYMPPIEKRAALAWAFVHGIELDWFVDRGGFLNWSERGKQEYARAIYQPVVTEPAADETPFIPPTSSLTGSQLSLFGGAL